MTSSDTNNSQGSPPHSFKFYLEHIGDRVKFSLHSGRERKRERRGEPEGRSEQRDEEE